ncbi:hypothetical protein L3X37_11765 [Sabulilitoribacter arenilitoris]|uniref:Uncharacterized protein n=1 Tax=Wocania arenilitoris TaxID=2044858 RepID=A0AAE3JQB4_9FLAO|nr:hypothetical protein [Wocania arenilitoris]MCF7569035.1 hypothetical protein [Wocania arenilitoris]
MIKLIPPNIALLTMLFVYTIVNSCASKQKSIQDATAEESNPRLLFLNYKMSEDDNGNKTIKFINKIITEGKLKQNSYTNESVYGDLICNQLDKKSNVLQSITIKNPLVKNFEFVNDLKQFERKNVELKTAEFSLKLKLEPYTKYITINEITKNKTETKPLVKTIINQL